MEEYNETKLETQDQLREFQAFLERSLRGDMTLVDEFGAAQAVSWGEPQAVFAAFFLSNAAMHALLRQKLTIVSRAVYSLLRVLFPSRPSKPPCPTRSRPPR